MQMLRILLTCAVAEGALYVCVCVLLSCAVAVCVDVLRGMHI